MKNRKEVHEEVLRNANDSKVDKEVQEESTVIHSQQKTAAQSNNFIVNSSESRLLNKPKMEVGDRDKLKKKALMLDANPEIIRNSSKEVIHEKMEVSIQIPETTTKDFSQMQIFPKKNVSTQCENNGFHGFE